MVRMVPTYSYSPTLVESGTEQEAIMKEQVEAFNEAVQKQCENVATVSIP